MNGLSRARHAVLFQLRPDLKHDLHSLSLLLIDVAVGTRLELFPIHRAVFRCEVAMLNTSVFCIKGVLFGL